MSMAFLFVTVVSWSLSFAVTQSERSLTERVPALVQRELLSSSNCIENPVGGFGDFVNPSNVDMAMVYIDGTDDDELQKPDFGNSSDVKADGNWAMKWCKAVFGANSYPMFPSTADRVTAMKSLCDNKGSNEGCYFGMYRPVDDVTDDTYAESTCDTLRNHDGSFSIDPEDLTQTHANGGIGGQWTGSAQPSCEWYDSQHARYTTANRDWHQCLEYRPAAPNKFFMAKCDNAMHIICYRVDSTCNVPVTLS